MQAGFIVLAMATSALALPATDTINPGATVEGSGYRVAVAAMQEQQQPIDVNTASEDELQVVPGIGPAMAQRIISWREQHGPFERIEDLLNVRGIGVKTLEKLRPYLMVRPENAIQGR